MGDAPSKRQVIAAKQAPKYNLEHRILLGQHAYMVNSDQALPDYFEIRHLYHSNHLAHKVSVKNDTFIIDESLWGWKLDISI